MPLQPGDKLGPYEILAPIGAGGMGEVWKACDIRLDRIVAIKTSKAQFSERFGREAKAIAALNHPHICQLYDVGPDYLVMEYVEGSPLKGPLATEKAVDYAGQVLSALDAAHRKGIIHRDLKPANILVTKQHGIKLLDFGLARITSSSADSTLTLAGERMGTPAYMAPEQWEGEPGDSRTDIYCFGCVLYEMLTGKRALQEGRASLKSPLLDSIVRTCMEPIPEERWQTASDVWRAMSITAPPVPKPNRAWQRVGLAALVVFGAGMFVRPLFDRVPAAVERVSFAIYPPEKTAFSNSPNVTVNAPQFALAPDGRAIVFAAGREGERPLLWRRSMDEVTAQPLQGTEDGQDPFWSPDSRWIGFFAEGKLKKVPAAGGAVEVVVPTVRDVRGGPWGKGDTILFANGIDPIQRVAATGGAETPVTILEPGESSHRYPQFLPDGHHFLYVVRGVRNGQPGVYVGTLDDKRKKLVAQVESSAVYAVPGYLLFGQGEALFGQIFDAAHLEAGGQPFLVAAHAGHTSTYKSAISASASGVIAYAGTLSPNGSLTWFDRGGRRLDSAGPEGYYSDFRISPNEKALAASMLDPRTGFIELWIIDLERGSNSRVSNDGATITATPLWSPDGARYVFRRSRGAVELNQRSAAGGGSDQVVLSYENIRLAGIQSTMLIDSDWSPDGKSIIFSVPGPNSGTDLWLLPLTGDKKPIKFLATPADEMHGNFSPDGHLVAYTSNETGKFQVNVQTLPLSDKKWQVSTSSGYEPRWRADGREIYYLSEDRKLMSVAVGAGPSFGVPTALFQTRAPHGITPNRMHYVPSRDGQRFLVNTQSDDEPPTPITVVLNWAAGLKKTPSK
jgi:Tol biopolymer transport system component/predicted Ser/Thr protein kinase